jgi:rhodanese-related sulfurtransferase
VLLQIRKQRRSGTKRIRSPSSPIGARAGSRFALCGFVYLLLPVLAFASDFQTPAITAEQLHARQEGPDALLVIDVRDSGEYKSGHVPGAINIPQKKLDKQIDKLGDAEGVVLYCINGRRTRLAEQTLIEHDIPNVYHLEGGLMGWRQAAYKVRTGWGP